MNYVVIFLLALFVTLYAGDGIAARLIRVPQTWLRVPAWLVFFPMYALVHVLEVAAMRDWRRFAAPEFYEWIVNGFFIGLFGTLVGLEIGQ